jgi:hypothetical protein
MRQQCSGVRTRQISFIRNHNVSLILQSAVRSHHSIIYNYTPGNPHVIKDGYWRSYNHVVLQLEHCTDVFNALYSQFDIVYELDHSSGQDKEKADGRMATPPMLG